MCDQPFPSILSQVFSATKLLFFIMWKSFVLLSAEMQIRVKVIARNAETWGSELLMWHMLVPLITTKVAARLYAWGLGSCVTLFKSRSSFFFLSCQIQLNSDLLMLSVDYSDNCGVVIDASHGSLEQHIFFSIIFWPFNLQWLTRSTCR